MVAEEDGPEVGSASERKPWQRHSGHHMGPSESCPHGLAVYVGFLDVPSAVHCSFSLSQVGSTYMGPGEDSTSIRIAVHEQFVSQVL